MVKLAMGGKRLIYQKEGGLRRLGKQAKPPALPWATLSTVGPIRAFAGPRLPLAGSKWECVLVAHFLLCGLLEGSGIDERDVGFFPAEEFGDR